MYSGFCGWGYIGVQRVEEDASSNDEYGDEETGNGLLSKKLGSKSFSSTRSFAERLKSQLNFRSSESVLESAKVDDEFASLVDTDDKGREDKEEVGRSWEAPFLFLGVDGRE